MIVHGDCIEAMAAMEPESVDAIVTDPPYGLEFMGKEWDRLGRDGPASFENLGTAKGLPPEAVDGARGGRAKAGSTTSTRYFNKPRFSTLTGDSMRAAQQWHQQWAEAAYRVAKPSAYLLAFGGTRTVHRMTVALEDAGWVIRDMLVWAYASGFPKSKASLKPAWEPIVMARKPGPLRDLAIDACRIPASPEDEAARASTRAAWSDSLEAGRIGTPRQHVSLAAAVTGDSRVSRPQEALPAGRWPANVILTDPIFDGGVEGVVGGGNAPSAGRYLDVERPKEQGVRGGLGKDGPSHLAGLSDGRRDNAYANDSGTYSRFFLVPKADRQDREPVLGGIEPSGARPLGISQWEGQTNGSGQTMGPSRPRANSHPTVKPTDLMRHLVRLVTPTGGTVLDPFLGSGTTALACELEGFPWIGIEREAEYVAIAEARLNGTQRGLGLEIA